MRILKWFRNLWKKDPNFMDINPDHASLKKVLYWRLISIEISTSVAYYYLNELLTSIEMTLVEAVVLTSMHYIFEELWEPNKKNKNNKSEND